MFLPQAASTSGNLYNASITRDSSDLTVTCIPDDEASASCVLVFRAHGNSSLNCSETFPITIVLDPQFNYTFAIFRKANDHDIDERPFIMKFVPGEVQPTVTGKLYCMLC